MSDQLSGDFFARHADNLLANGYRLVPIGPGTKKPQRRHFDEWQDMPDWQRFAERQPQPVELAQWKSWPGAGIGIACGNVVGIDIDVMDAELSIRLRNLALRMLGDTPLIRIGLAPKALLVYRATEPFRGRKRHPIEVLALGQQFVACATHPGTGQPYQWPDEHPDTVDVSSLPVVTEAQALAFLDAAY